MKIYFLLAMLLVGCSSGGGSHSGGSTPPPTASDWYFGPIVNGQNYSKNMPVRPSAQGSAWKFTFPGPSGEVDAVVNDSPMRLVGKKTVVIHYSVTGGGFMASGENAPGRVGFMIQRRGDDWSGKGKYQQYRLYGLSRPVLKAGDGTVTVSLASDQMTDVMGKKVSQEVIDGVTADLGSYSVVFGGSAASHGVYATQTSTFTFSMEAQ